MDLQNWVPPDLPSRSVMKGRYVILEPLQPAHTGELWSAHAGHDDIWRYIPAGPFPDEDALGNWVQSVCDADDPLQFAVRTEDGRLGGTLSIMRVNPTAGSAEVGYIVFSPQLQRTRDATEAVYLTIKWAFEAGYRRFEWKCNARNLASRRAAERFGFSYEGVFRQAAIVKGENRDTAWFASIDGEWPALKTAFETWLDPANFDASGQQRQSLSELTKPILVTRDPSL